MNNFEVKLHLDKGSHVTIINEKKTTGKILVNLLTKTEDVARVDSRKGICFRGEIACNFSYAGKALKTKVNLKK